MISVMVRSGAGCRTLWLTPHSTFSDHPPLPRASKFTHADWRRYCKNKRTARNRICIEASSMKKAIPSKNAVVMILSGILLVFRYLLFFVLYWLRGPVMLVCELLCFPMLLAWLFALYAFPDFKHMVWGFGIMSFSTFILMWVYDFILMSLSPGDMILTR